MPAKVVDSEYLILARSGYRDEWGEHIRHLWSSNYYCAYLIGQYMKATCRSEPWEVRKSQGYSWFVNDMKLRWMELPLTQASAQPANTFIRIT